MMRNAGLAVLLLGFVGAVASVPASASSVLYDNTTSSSGTINGANINGGIAISDSFTLAQSATITGADFDILVHPSDSLSSFQWSIGSSSFGGTATTASILSSTYVGLLAGTYPIYDETISIPSLTLAAGTYWLTLQNAVTADSGGAYWDVSNGPSSTAYADESGSTLSLDNYFVTGTNSETFQLLGTTTATPEPSTFMLLGSGLAGFAGMVRRKLKA